MSFFDYPNEASAAPSPVSLLADATDEEWATVLGHTRYRRFSPGETVVTAGARAVRREDEHGGYRVAVLRRWQVEPAFIRHQRVRRPRR